MLNVADAMPFSKLMGVKITQAGPDGVIGELEVRADLCTTGHIMHGGAIMALADTVGAVGAFASLPKGATGTVTVESKTNFLAPAPEGAKVKASAVVIKNGRQLSVWRTSIETAEGVLVAEVTQTQLVLY